MWYVVEKEANNIIFNTYKFNKKYMFCFYLRFLKKL